MKKSILSSVVLFLSACTSIQQEWVTINGFLLTPQSAQKVVTHCEVAFLQKTSNTKNEHVSTLDVAKALEFCMLSNGLVRKEVLYEYTPLLVEATARRINNNVPVMVDYVTRLDSVESMNRTLRLNHTILDDLVEDIDVDYFNAVVSKLVKKSTCFRRQTVMLLENEAVFEYFYFDANEEVIASFSIEISDCD